MFSRVTLTSSVFLAGILGLLTSCGGGTNNSPPRFSTIPGQSASSPMGFSLDLGGYATDKEGQPMTFSVVSGGGSFSGSTYQNNFDTVGTYTVVVEATDAANKSTQTSFEVKITSGNLAAVQWGDNLLLLDTDTTKTLTVTNSAGFTDALVAVLAQGKVAYDRSQSGTKRLFIYDPHSRTTTTIGDSSAHSSVFAASTSAGDVLFTNEVSASETNLFIFEASSQAISAISTSLGEHDRNPLVSSSGKIFYERGVAGQPDIYYYDPTTKLSTAVSTAANNETLRAALPSGAVVFSQLSGTGEQDLFHFKLGDGLVEMAVDLGATVQGQTKTYKGTDSQSRVIFEVSGASKDLYMWDSTTATSRLVATTGVDETFVAVTPADELLFSIATGAGNQDLSLYDYTADITVVVSSDVQDDAYLGSLSNGDIVFSRDTGAGGQDLFFFDRDVTSTVVIATTGNDDYTFDKLLSNGNVVFSGSGATAGVKLFNSTSQTVVSIPLFDATSVFGGETSGGDFVVRTTVSAQNDLLLWDQSAAAGAGAVVTVSSVAGNDAFGAGAANSRLLFTRVPAGQTNKELFLWDETSQIITQLTEPSTYLPYVDVDHTVTATFIASDI